MITLWKCPSPSSSFRSGVAFKTLPKRSSVLIFEYEGPDDGWLRMELKFIEVVALRCTYLPALTAELIQSSYDSLVDMGLSPWLAEVLGDHSGQLSGLRHLRICFDDGPCYEFLCREYLVSVV